MNINILDLFLIALILGGGILGLIVGASRMSLPFALIFVCTAIAYNYPRISGSFDKEGVLARMFLYLLVLFISIIVLGLLMRVLRNAIDSNGLRPFDKLLGLMIGIMTGALLSGALSWEIATNGSWELSMTLKNSKIAQSALVFFQNIMSLTERFFPQPEIKPWWKRPLW